MTSISNFRKVLSNIYVQTDAVDHKFSRDATLDLNKLASTQTGKLLLNKITERHVIHIQHPSAKEKNVQAVEVSYLPRATATTPSFLLLAREFIQLYNESSDGQEILTENEIRQEHDLPLDMNEIDINERPIPSSISEEVDEFFAEHFGKLGIG